MVNNETAGEMSREEGDEGNEDCSLNHSTTTSPQTEEQLLNDSSDSGESVRLLTATPSLFCSVPLNKDVQSILDTFPKTEFASEETASSSTCIANTSKKTRKHACLYCDRTFVAENLRQKHIERTHSAKQARRSSSRIQQSTVITKCLFCERFTDNDEGLADLFEHLVLEHPREYFGCLECKERFFSASQLEEHDVDLHGTKREIKVQSREDSENSAISESSVTTRLKSKESRESGVYRKAKVAMSHRDLRNKRIAIKSTKLGIKRSTRLQSKILQTKPPTKRKRKDKEAIEERKPEKDVVKVLATENPYPTFDAFYRVKKITDHSIDNLRISSLTFTDVFDRAFFTRVKCNIQDNLLNHIDGKLFKNEESESRISNFEKADVSATENYGCDISLNAATPVPCLLTTQFGEDLESQIEYGSKASKKKTTPKKDEIHYKYFTRRKYQASILESKENRDLSKLDMWTQFVIKNRQQKIVEQTQTDKEQQDYKKGNEYRAKLQNEELNRILDRRGAFEDLKAEASKKAALEGNYNPKAHAEISSILEDILSNVFISTIEDTEVKTELTDTEIPSYLNLRKASLSQESYIDKSDKISLICSSQETDNFDDPQSLQPQNPNTLAELTGEWARSRLFICAACGLRLANIKLLMDHKNIVHQNVWCQHYEFVGNQGEFYKHLSIPGLGKMEHLEETPGHKLWKRSEARICTKCQKHCNSLGELHRHILECGEDWSWMLVRKKCKYKPFGSKTRKKRRGLFKRIIHNKEKSSAECREKKVYKKLDGPRVKPSDAETIQRMLANLPAKRATRKVMSLKDGFPKKSRKEKTSCKKSAGRIAPIKSQKQEGEVVLKRKVVGKCNPVGVLRKSIRNLNKVISSQLLDTSGTLRMKTKIKNAIEKRKRLTRKTPAEPEEASSVPEESANNELAVESVDMENLSEESARKTRSSNNIAEVIAQPESSPKSVVKRKVKSSKKTVTNKMIRTLTLRQKHKEAEENTDTTNKGVKNTDNTKNNGKRKFKFDTFKNAVKKLKLSKRPPATPPNEAVEDHFLEKDVGADKLNNCDGEDIEEKEEIECVELKVPETSETPVNIEITSEKEDNKQGESSTRKAKFCKRAKGLNACIAMLTNKLMKTDETTKKENLQAVFEPNDITNLSHKKTDSCSSIMQQSETLEKIASVADDVIESLEPNLENAKFENVLSSSVATNAENNTLVSMIKSLKKVERTEQLNGNSDIMKVKKRKQSKKIGSVRKRKTKVMDVEIPSIITSPDDKLNEAILRDLQSIYKTDEFRYRSFKRIGENRMVPRRRPKITEPVAMQEILESITVELEQFAEAEKNSKNHGALDLTTKSSKKLEYSVVPLETEMQTVKLKLSLATALTSRKPETTTRALQNEPEVLETKSFKDLVPPGSDSEDDLPLSHFVETKNATNKLNKGDSVAISFGDSSSKSSDSSSQVNNESVKEVVTLHKTDEASSIEAQENPKTVELGVGSSTSTNEHLQLNGLIKRDNSSLIVNNASSRTKVNLKILQLGIKEDASKGQTKVKSKEKRIKKQKAEKLVDCNESKDANMPNLSEQQQRKSRGSKKKIKQKELDDSLISPANQTLQVNTELLCGIYKEKIDSQMLSYNSVLKESTVVVDKDKHIPEDEQIPGTDVLKLTLPISIEKSNLQPVDVTSNTELFDNNTQKKNTNVKSGSLLCLKIPTITKDSLTNFATSTPTSYLTSRDIKNNAFIKEAKVNKNLVSVTNMLLSKAQNLLDGLSNEYRELDMESNLLPSAHSLDLSLKTMKEGVDAAGNKLSPFVLNSQNLLEGMLQSIHDKRVMEDVLPQPTALESYKGIDEKGVIMNRHPLTFGAFSLNCSRSIESILESSGHMPSTNDDEERMKRKSSKSKRRGRKVGDDSINSLGKVRVPDQLDQQNLYVTEAFGQFMTDIFTKKPGNPNIKIDNLPQIPQAFIENCVEKYTKPAFPLCELNPKITPKEPQVVGANEAFTISESLVTNTVNVALISQELSTNQRSDFSESNNTIKPIKLVNETNISLDAFVGNETKETHSCSTLEGNPNLCFTNEIVNSELIESAGNESAKDDGEFVQKKSKPSKRRSTKKNNKYESEINNYAEDQYSVSSNNSLISEDAGKKVLKELQVVEDCYDVTDEPAFSFLPDKNKVKNVKSTSENAQLEIENVQATAETMITNLSKLLDDSVPTEINPYVISPVNAEVNKITDLIEDGATKDFCDKNETVVNTFQQEEHGRKKENKRKKSKKDKLPATETSDNKDLQVAGLTEKGDENKINSSPVKEFKAFFEYMDTISKENNEDELSILSRNDNIQNEQDECKHLKKTSQANDSYNSNSKECNQEISNEKSASRKEAVLSPVIWCDGENKTKSLTINLNKVLEKSNEFIILPRKAEETSGFIKHKNNALEEELKNVPDLNSENSNVSISEKQQDSRRMTKKTSLNQDTLCEHNSIYKSISITSANHDNTSQQNVFDWAGEANRNLEVAMDLNTLELEKGKEAPNCSPRRTKNNSSKQSLSHDPIHEEHNVSEPIAMVSPNRVLHSEQNTFDWADETNKNAVVGMMELNTTHLENLPKAFTCSPRAKRKSLKQNLSDDVDNEDSVVKPIKESIIITLPKYSKNSHRIFTCEDNENTSLEMKLDKAQLGKETSTSSKRRKKKSSRHYSSLELDSEENNTKTSEETTMFSAPSQYFTAQLNVFDCVGDSNNKKALAMNLDKPEMEHVIQTSKSTKKKSSKHNSSYKLYNEESEAKTTEETIMMTSPNHNITVQQNVFDWAGEDISKTELALNSDMSQPEKVKESSDSPKRVIKKSSRQPDKEDITNNTTVQQNIIEWMGEDNNKTTFEINPDKAELHKIKETTNNSPKRTKKRSTKQNQSYELDSPQTAEKIIKMTSPRHYLSLQQNVFDCVDEDNKTTLEMNSDKAELEKIKEPSCNSLKRTKKKSFRQKYEEDNEEHISKTTDEEATFPNDCTTVQNFFNFNKSLGITSDKAEFEKVGETSNNSTKRTKKKSIIQNHNYEFNIEESNAKTREETSPNVFDWSNEANNKTTVQQEKVNESSVLKRSNKKSSKQKASYELDINDKSSVNTIGEATVTSSPNRCIITQQNVFAWADEDKNKAALVINLEQEQVKEDNKTTVQQEKVKESSALKRSNKKSSKQKGSPYELDMNEENSVNAIGETTIMTSPNRCIITQQNIFDWADGGKKKAALVVNLDVAQLETSNNTPKRTKKKSSQQNPFYELDQEERYAKTTEETTVTAFSNHHIIAQQNVLDWACDDNNKTTLGMNSDKVQFEKVKEISSNSPKRSKKKSSKQHDLHELDNEESNRKLKEETTVLTSPNHCVTLQQKFFDWAGEGSNKPLGTKVDKSKLNSPRTITSKYGLDSDDMLEYSSSWNSCMSTKVRNADEPTMNFVAYTKLKGIKLKENLPDKPKVPTNPICGSILDITPKTLSKVDQHLDVDVVQDEKSSRIINNKSLEPAEVPELLNTDADNKIEKRKVRSNSKKSKPLESTDILENLESSESYVKGNRRATRKSQSNKNSVIDELEDEVINRKQLTEIDGAEANEIEKNKMKKKLIITDHQKLELIDSHSFEKPEPKKSKQHSAKIEDVTSERRINTRKHKPINYSEEIVETDDESCSTDIPSVKVKLKNIGLKSKKTSKMTPESIYTVVNPVNEEVTKHVDLPDSVSENNQEDEACSAINYENDFIVENPDDLNALPPSRCKIGRNSSKQITSDGIIKLEEPAVSKRKSSRSTSSFEDTISYDKTHDDFKNKQENIGDEEIPEPETITCDELHYKQKANNISEVINNLIEDENKPSDKFVTNDEEDINNLQRGKKVIHEEAHDISASNKKSKRKRKRNSSNDNAFAEEKQNTVISIFSIAEEKPHNDEIKNLTDCVKTHETNDRPDLKVRISRKSICMYTEDVSEEESQVSDLDENSQISKSSRKKDKKHRQKEVEEDLTNEETANLMETEESPQTSLRRSTRNRDSQNPSEFDKDEETAKTEDSFDLNEIEEKEDVMIQLVNDNSKENMYNQTSPKRNKKKQLKLKIGTETNSYLFDNEDNIETETLTPLKETKNTEQNESYLQTPDLNDTIISAKLNTKLKVKQGKGKKDKISMKKKEVSNEMVEAYCDICNKSFVRTDSLAKHKRTLTHIAKLSEIEAREAEEKNKRDPVNAEEPVSTDYQENLPSPFSLKTNNENLLADIINDVLNKPVNEENIESFTDILEQKQEAKRYKSLGERKSFDSDSSNLYNNANQASFTSHIGIGQKTDSLLEKQIFLLENIIEENKASFQYIDEVSNSSKCPSDMSLESDIKPDDSNIISYTRNTLIDNEDTFVKPTQYEEISEDSLNTRNYEEQRARKALNRDEELFLECCSLLKSSSEVSNYSKKSNKLPEVYNQYNAENWNKDLMQNHVSYDSEEYLSDRSRTSTPIGENYNDLSNSETIRTDWNTKLKEQRDFEDISANSSRSNEPVEFNRFHIDFINQKGLLDEGRKDLEFSTGDKDSKEVSNLPQSHEPPAVDENFDNVKIDDKNISKSRTSKPSGEATQTSITDYTVPLAKQPGGDSPSSLDGKKMLTKGAKKVFEGLKVSIPREELDMNQVLNCSPTSKRLELENCDIFKEKPKTGLKKFGNKLGLKVTKKRDKSELRKAVDDASKEKIHDVYDFEETQDNAEVYVPEDLFAFRKHFAETVKEIVEVKGTADDAVQVEESDTESNNQYIDSFSYEGQSVSSFSTETESNLSLKKNADAKNITKKKCVIMGRIFKNAAKSKPDDIDDIPEIESEKLVETYVKNCSKKEERTKMSEQEMDLLFNRLLEDNQAEKSVAASVDEIPASPNKVPKVKQPKVQKQKKRPRKQSESSGDEFNLNKSSKKRSVKKDDSINLEQELKECMGVAGRKSQRKCTSGKQNVLVEYWSSDDSDFEALIQQKLGEETKPAQEVIEEKPVQLAAAKQPPEPIDPAFLREIVKDVQEAAAAKAKQPRRKAQPKPAKQTATAAPPAAVSTNDSLLSTRRKRAAADTLYYWSSSSDDESQNLIEVKSVRDDDVDDDDDRPMQHGWIVGDSPKKLVTMLAQAKGKKIDPKCVKEQGKKRTTL